MNISQNWKLALRTTALSALIALGASASHTAAAPVIPAAAAAGSTLQQRVDQRKAEQAITLSDTDSKRLVGTCAQAQAKVALLQNSTSTMLANRATTYSTVDARLWITIGSLKLASQDTFQLQKDRQTLSDKTDAFNALGANYKQTLDDIVVMNCAADPTGFRALVNTAQSYYAALKSQSADSRSFIINTVKPELTAFSSGLQSKSTSEAN